jgi:ribosomal protein S1
VALAQSWAKTLEKQTEVVWLTKGDAPWLKIRKDGVLVEGGVGSEGFIPLNQFSTRQGSGLRASILPIEILNGDKKVLAVSSGDRNYFVGLSLIDQLMRKQQPSMAATNRG